MVSKIKEFFIDDIKRDILFLVVSAVFLLASVFGKQTSALQSLPFDLAWVAIVLCGLPIIKEAIVGLATSFDIKADVLVSLALVASIITGEIFAAAEVALIMQIGALLEELTVAKARAGIEKLVHLTPTVARVLRDGIEVQIPAHEVVLGDILRVLPGETIAVDGIIVAGKTSVNQAVMTGESMPVDKQEGDEVSSGTVNQFGAFDMRATKVGEDSSLQRMIRLVQSADAGKAKIVALADRWATWVVVIALASALGTWSITGEILRAVTILVVFCPCALVLATPTAIMAAIGNVTKYGILVREGDALERLSQTSCLAFDKTGTLTSGKPLVSQVKSLCPVISDSDLFRLAASAELRSEHPIGKALVASYRKEHGVHVPEVQDFTMLPGRGVCATAEEKTLLVGNRELLADHQVNFDDSEASSFIEDGCTCIFVAIDGTFVGFIALSDTMRPEAPATIQVLHTLGFEPILLTGDHSQAACSIAARVKIENVHSDCQPEQKLAIIDSYQAQKKLVCMVGDGINDAPALKKAHVGIAMGGIGSDIAVDAADIVLVNDDISVLPHLLQLSKRMMGTIKFNMAAAMLLNFTAIIFAMLGYLNPLVGALVHNAGSVVVILNSAVLLRWKK